MGIADIVHYKIAEILTWASNCEDIKLVLRWSNTLASIYVRENKKKNIELTRDIIKHCEYLSQKLCDINDEEILERLGPNLLDTLLKLNECLVKHERLEKEILAQKLEEEEESSSSTISLSDQQIENMLNISNLLL